MDYERLVGMAMQFPLRGKCAQPFIGKEERAMAFRRSPRIRALHCAPEFHRTARPASQAQWISAEGRTVTVA
jgi:hypothetical protein